MTPFLVNIFHNIEVPNNILRNPPTCIFFHAFLFLLTSSINIPEFFIDFMILIISYISLL